MSRAQDNLSARIDDFIIKLEDLKDIIDDASSASELEGKFDEVNEEFKGLKEAYYNADEFTECDNCSETYDDADLEDDLCEPINFDKEHTCMRCAKKVNDKNELLDEGICIECFNEMQETIPH